MKKLLTLTLISHLLMTPSYAQEATGHYPTAINYCGNVVNTTLGLDDYDAVAQYFWSRDCKTIFLMPPARGTVEVIANPNITNLKSYCPVVRIQRDRLIEKNKHVKEIENKLFEHAIHGNLTDMQVKRLENYLAQVKSEVSKIQTQFDKVEAGKAVMRFDASPNAKYVQDFVMANQHLVHKGINIEMMPVDFGFLSFPKLADSANGSLIHLAISGIPVPPQKDVGDSGNLNFVMKDRSTAQLVFGLSKGCDIYERIKEAERQDRDLGNSEIEKLFLDELNPTYNYKVKLSSIASYTAKLNAEDFVGNFYKKMQRKSKFSLQNIEEVLLESDLVSLISFEFDEGLSLTPENKKTLEDSIYKEVAKRFTSILLKKLKALKVVEDIHPDSGLQAPDAGTVSEYAGMKRTCKRWLWKKKCRTYPFYRLHHVDGTLNNDFIKEVSSKIQLEETVRHNSFYDFTGSSVFNYVGGSHE